MTEKEIKEAPEKTDELTDNEIEDAAGGKPANVYGGPSGGTKFE